MTIRLFSLFYFILGCAFALQSDTSAEGLFMVIGGFNGSYLDEVEIVSTDPVLRPVPDCLSQLNPLPALTGASAGALDYLGKSYPLL